MRPIIRDVAARAGVSQKTVSRVINSESGFAAATAARVAAAIDELAGGAGEPQGDVEALRARPPHPPAGEGRW